MEANKKITLKNAEQYRWGNAGMGWILANSKDVTVAERLLAPGVKEVKHYHKTAWQFFYIIKGEGTIEINGEKIELIKNESIHVDPGQHHQLANTSDENLQYLVISVPNSYDDRVELES